MAKKVSFNDIPDKNTDWGFDERNGFPYSGQSVQNFIKRLFNSKAGIFHYDTTNNQYLVFSDVDNRDIYLKDPTRTDLIIGMFGGQGEKGEKGDQGPQGPVGPQGETGEKGEQGDIGPQGPEGPKGLQGPQGPQGNSGYSGAAGELEVVNNLSQGGANAALSAEMGKELTRYAKYGRIVGNDSTMAYCKHFGFVAGHKYRINVLTPSWDVAFNGVANDAPKFNIKYKLYSESSETLLYWVPMVAQSNAIAEVMPSYIFTAKEDTEYLIIGVRNTKGVVVEYEIDDITSVDIIGDYFEGNTNTFSSKRVYVQKGRKYRVTLPETEWQFDRRLRNDLIFEIYYKTEEGSLKTVASAREFADLKSQYTFTAALNGLYYIGGRADAGVKVYFHIEDVTDQTSGLSVVGKGNSLSSIQLRDIYPGHYRLRVLSDWDIADMGTTSTYQFEIYYYTTGDAYKRLAAGRFGQGTPIVKGDLIEFQIPNAADIKSVHLGIRAASGSNVYFALEETDCRDKVVLYGNNNYGVATPVYLPANATFSCFLPETRWDISGITLDYEYYIFEVYYTTSGGVSVELASLKAFDEYKNKFSFTTPVEGDYYIYIRATNCVKVPIYILPTNGDDIATYDDVFSEQLYRAGNLGFKRLPDTRQEGYISTLSFVHISDTHCTDSTHLSPFVRAARLFNELAENDVNRGRNVKFLLHTGDVRSMAYTSGYSFFYNIIADLKRNVYVTAGNHDVGHKLDATIAGTDEQLYEQMFAPMLEKWALKSDGGGTPHPDGKNYYFTDFSDEKVRMIVLYEWETDFELNPSDASLLLYDRSSRAFRQEQIDWFINSLMTTPAGYGVIVVKHQPESIKGVFDNPFFSNVAVLNKKEMSTYCGTELISQIVQAFIDRQSINVSVKQTGGVVTTLYANADFSAVAEGAEFICYCSGHTHQDVVTFLRDYPKQLELTIGCNNVHYTEGSDMLQEEGGKSEVLMNVYNIDRNRGYVYIVRIGADFSNTAQNRSFTAIKYRKNE